MGGFCEGAKAMMKGDTGFKIVKKPAVCGNALDGNLIITQELTANTGTLQRDSVGEVCEVFV
jgi:hypothetical protein